MDRRWNLITNFRNFKEQYLMLLLHGVINFDKMRRVEISSAYPYRKIEQCF